MSAEVRKLVPFGGSVRADMGQSRGAQSGEPIATSLLANLDMPVNALAHLDGLRDLVPIGFTDCALGGGEAGATAPYPRARCHEGNQLAYLRAHAFATEQ